MSSKLIKQHDLTTGDITRGIWSFAVPLMLGNVMQQLYNLVDTWVVGTYLGNGALAAFAVAVKIDTIAYMSVQDFGNASSVFVAQNFGAGDKERIRIGIRKAFLNVTLFCVLISAIVFVFAESFMKIFVTEANSQDVIAAGVQYLRIEGTFYIGIGIWAAIPIGWFLADAVGLMNLHRALAYHSMEKM